MAVGGNRVEIAPRVTSISFLPSARPSCTVNMSAGPSSAHGADPLRAPKASKQHAVAQARSRRCRRTSTSALSRGDARDGGSPIGWRRARSASASREATCRRCAGSRAPGTPREDLRRARPRRPSALVLHAGGCATPSSATSQSRRRATNRRFPPEATEITSHVGSVSRFMWARANGPSSIRDGAWHLRATTVCDAAAAAGSLGVVKARELGYAWSERTCAAAAEGGSIETLEWLRSTSKQPRKERCPWDVRSAREAARRGHLRAARLGAQAQVQVGRADASLAANSGHLHVLKWARSRGAPWDGELLMEALRGGDRRRVRKPTDPPDNHYARTFWAIENGAPVDDEQLLYEVAAAVGSLPVLNYLKDQYGGAWRSPEEWRQLRIDAITHIHSGPVSAAAMNGHVDVLEWLHNIAMEHANSVPGFALPEYFFEQIVSRAASNSRDPVAVLRWCHEKGHTDFRPTRPRASSSRIARRASMSSSSFIRSTRRGCPMERAPSSRSAATLWRSSNGSSRRRAAYGATTRLYTAGRIRTRISGPSLMARRQGNREARGAACMS